MRPPPNATLGEPADIHPPPASSTSDPSSSSSTSPLATHHTFPSDPHPSGPLNLPLGLSATAFPYPPNRSMHTYTVDHKLHAKIQKLRNLPFESSPLAWPDEDSDWEDVPSDTSEEDDEEDDDDDEEDDDEEDEDGEIDILTEGMPWHEPIVDDAPDYRYPPAAPSSDSPYPSYPPYAYPPAPILQQGRFTSPALLPDPQQHLAQSAFTTPPREIDEDPFKWLGPTPSPPADTFTDLPLTEYPPRPPRPPGSLDLTSPPRSLRLRIRPVPVAPHVSSPPSSPGSSSDPSISPGSGHTKIIIRRGSSSQPSSSSTSSAPSSSSALANVTQADDDADMETDDEDTPTPSLRRSHHPNPIYIAHKLQQKANRVARRTRSTITVGGRLKTYDENSPRMYALFRSWEDGLMSRWDPVEAYTIMQKPLPMLGSPPPGFGAIGLPVGQGGVGMERDISFRPSSKASKRLRYSPETVKRGVEMGLLRSPEGSTRKKGKMSGSELTSVPMTRMPSPMPDFDTHSGASTGGSSWTTGLGIDEWQAANPEFVFSIRPPSPPATGYTVNPRTGRRTPIASPIELAFPSTPQRPQSAAIHSYPPPAGIDTPPWEVMHLEHSDDTPPSPTGPTVQPVSFLGLSLGESERSEEMGASSLPVELAGDDQQMAEDSQRLRLSAAVDELAGQHSASPSPSDWTPPMRVSSIDDTPSTVSDELITTPEMDMTDLPASSSSTPPKADRREESDDEEAPRPRLDKGKGRARPEVETPVVSTARVRGVDAGDARMPVDVFGGYPISEPDISAEARLEVLVMEVSRLEAQQAELKRDEGNGASPCGSLERRIKSLNREIRKLSKSIGFINQSMTKPAEYVMSDEEIAYRLQEEYEQEEAAMLEVERSHLLSIQRPRPAGGVQMERSERSTPPPDYSRREPMPRRVQQAARQLFFNSPESAVPEPMARGPVSNLLARSSIFGTDTDPALPGTVPDGIRLRNRGPQSAMHHSRPIAIPQLYPPPKPKDDKVHIVVTPPTPLQQPRRPESVNEGPRFLADPLEMSALALGDASGGSEQEAEGEDVDMGEGGYDTDISVSSDETIRPRRLHGRDFTQAELDERRVLPRMLQEAYDSAPSVAVPESPPTLRRSAMDLQRPARVLFGPPGAQEPAQGDNGGQPSEQRKRPSRAESSFERPRPTLITDHERLHSSHSLLPSLNPSSASPRSPKSSSPTIHRLSIPPGPTHHDIMLGRRRMRRGVMMVLKLALAILLLWLFSGIIELFVDLD